MSAAASCLPSSTSNYPTTAIRSKVRRHGAYGREGTGSGFVHRYDLTKLVYFERHEDIRAAIQRQTSLERWPRAWKIRLLAAENPEWDDLYPSLLS
jgi:putative endonuclease